MKHKIIHENSLEILREMEKETVDMVFADPPYNLIGLDNFIDLSVYRKWAKKWVAECFRVLTWEGTFILCGRPPVLSYLVTDICEEGYVFREWITWHKTDSITAAKTYHSKNYECFAVFSKWMERKFNFLPVQSKTNHYSDTRNIGCIWEHSKIGKHHAEGTEHPNQKPIKFLERFVGTYTNENDLILDIFLGSGTSLVAAEGLNRNSIGIDISKKYCVLSYDRLSFLAKQLKIDKEPSIIEKVNF